MQNFSNFVFGNCKTSLRPEASKQTKHVQNLLNKMKFHIKFDNSAFGEESNPRLHIKESFIVFLEF